MLAVKGLVGVAPEVDLGGCTLHLPPQKQTRNSITFHNDVVASYRSNIFSANNLPHIVSIGQNVCQYLTHFISIGQNLHKVENQRTFGVQTL